MTSTNPLQTLDLVIVQAALAKYDIALSEADMLRFVSLIPTKKIEAIKLLREVAGADLKKAKDAVEFVQTITKGLKKEATMAPQTSTLSNTQIRFSAQLNQIIVERSRIWDEYDQSQANARTFNDLASRIDNNGPADTIDALLTNGTPPQELVQSINELQQEYGVIGKGQSDITQNEAEIKRIKSRLVKIYIGIGLFVLMIIAFIIFGAGALIVSLFSFLQ